MASRAAGKPHRNIVRRIEIMVPSYAESATATKADPGRAAANLNRKPLEVPNFLFQKGNLALRVQWRNIAQKFQ